MERKLEFLTRGDANSHQTVPVSSDVIAKKRGIGFIQISYDTRTNSPCGLSQG